MELAQILYPYSDGITEQSDIIQFLLDKISPRDFTRCIQLLTKLDLEYIKKYSGNRVISTFVTGLSDNKILNLLSTYRKLG